MCFKGRGYIVVISMSDAGLSESTGIVELALEDNPITANDVSALIEIHNTLMNLK